MSDTDPSAIESVWKWLLGIGVAIIGFLSALLFKKYDEEIDKVRLKIHNQNNSIHELSLELEAHKTYVAENYVRKARK